MVLCEDNAILTNFVIPEVILTTREVERLILSKRTNTSKKNSGS